MKPLLHTLNSKGSGTGYSYYSGFAKCPLCCQLDQDARDRNEETSVNGPAIDIGTIYHAYQELWRSEKIKASTVVRFSDTVEEASHTEALRLFSAYRNLYNSPHELGEIIAIETQMEGKAVEEAIGISPWTGRMDMVVRLYSKDVRRLKPTMMNQEDLCTGYWGVDYKTGGQKPSNLFEKRMRSIQYTGYITAWNVLNPGIPLKGLISDEAIKTKTPQFYRIAVPAPGVKQIAAMQSFYAGIAEIINHPVLSVWPNAHELNCFPFGRVCKWLAEGTCDRSM